MKVRIDEGGQISVTGTAKEWTDVLGYAWRANEGPTTEADGVTRIVQVSLRDMMRDEGGVVEGPLGNLYAGRGYENR